MASRPPLGVWLHGTRVAEITSSGPGRVSCRYTDEALARWPGGAPLLSCSMPLSPRRYRDAGRWFRGLLPEGRALQAMADAARVPTYDTFGMLERFGRDVAGAAVIAGDEPGPRPGGVVPYTPDQLAEEVDGLEDRPLALYDDSELSLAGLQNKLLLVETGDGWGRPTGGRPSTHILKVEDRRFPGLVEMEAACMRLARAVGLTTVEVEIVRLSDVDCIIVSRFDRRTDGASVVRIHQEDACQALARDPDAADRRGKYEYAGGPTLREIADVLDRYAADPVAELVRLARAAAFTTAIGNADAHGKNIAVVHEQPGQVALAPLYDTVPTASWPKLPDRAAMSIGGRTRLPDVTIADLVDEAASWRLDPMVAEEAVVETLEGVVASLTAAEVPAALATAIEVRCAQLLG